MGRYIVKRLIAMIPVVFVITLVVFAIVYLTPGGPAASMLGLEASADELAAMNERLGYNKPFAEQYLIWLNGLLHGDLGTSIFMNQPVSQSIAEHFIPSLTLAFWAELLAIAVALPLGTLAAVKRGSKLDGFLRVTSLVGVAIPGFLMALLLMMVLAEQLRILPVAGWQPLSKGIARHARYLVMPVLALAAPQSAVLFRMTRSSMIEALSLPCVKAARAKGMSEASVLVKYALRNAAAPIVTSIGYSFGALLTGVVVIEIIFNIPGFGQLVTSSIQRRDYPVIQGVLLLVALIYSLVNLAVDLICGAIDKRTRIWERSDG